MIDGYEDEALISASELRRVAGNISLMTEHRWSSRYPDFPQPYYISGRKYYRLGDWRRFRANRLNDSAPAPPGRANRRATDEEPDSPISAPSKNSPKVGTAGKPRQGNLP